MMNMQVNKNKHYPIKVIERQHVNTARKHAHVEKKKNTVMQLSAACPRLNNCVVWSKYPHRPAFYLFNTKVNEDIKDAKISRPWEGLRRWFIGGR